ncbi:MAG: hypothetical protein HY316_03935 [Acidobacteria bacterium]|nr:hypothetical protein [Acidobacteriota bacterium]
MAPWKHLRTWAFVTCLISLLLGVAAIVWADFGMPGWFFVLTQIWFWTLGLPTMLGVLLVTALWGIRGWTTLPLWLFIPCAAIVAGASQYGCLLALSRLCQRIARRHA